MNFRKVVFALATAGLGLTGIASAQITCTTAALTSGTTQFVRVEGTTEAVPGTTISGCTAGAAVSSVTITLNPPDMECTIYVRPGPKGELDDIKHDADKCVGRMVENLPLVKYLMIKNSKE